MLVKLTADEWRILEEVVNEHGRAMPLTLACERPSFEASAETVDDYRNLILEDYEARGLDQNYEPNWRGRVLESLIDKLFTG